MNKILRLVPALLFLAALFMINGCGSSSTESKSASLVTVSIGSNGTTASLAIRPMTLLARAELSLRKAWRNGLAVAAGIPATVKNITITVTAANMATINRNIQIAGQQEVTDTFEVPNGTGRLFSIHALDLSGKSIYSAETLRDLQGLPVEIFFHMSSDFLNVMPIAGAHGSISPSNQQLVGRGTTAQFTISPDSGYEIISPVGGTCPQGNLDGSTYTTGVITADCTVEPGFAILNYSVTPTAGANGSISPSTIQTVMHGVSQQFTITPFSGYNIASVSGCGGSLSGNTYTTGPITGACTVAATFSSAPPPTYAVTAIADANGTITPSGTRTVIAGQTMSFTVLPYTGFYVESVSGCDVSLSGNNYYTTAPITAACTVRATFSQAFYTVTPFPGTNGSINPSVPQTATSGSTKQFTIIPSTGYRIVTPVGGSCPQGILSGNTYTTGMIYSDCTVSPSFTIQTFTVTPIAATGGSISPSSPQTVNYGSTAQFIFTPYLNYYLNFETPAGGTCPQGSLITGGDIPDYITGNITSDCTVTPNFFQLL